MNRIAAEVDEANLVAGILGGAALQRCIGDYLALSRNL
jgi:hypothetical protein